MLGLHSTEHSVQTAAACRSEIAEARDAVASQSAEVVGIVVDFVADTAGFVDIVERVAVDTAFDWVPNYWKCRQCQAFSRVMPQC